MIFVINQYTMKNESHYLFRIILSVLKSTAVNRSPEILIYTKIHPIVKYYIEIPAEA